jgi:ELWxxDGT repeat protein
MTVLSISQLTNVNGILYFQADDGVNGDELWKSDGTEAGTVLVKDINVGSDSSDASDLTNVNGTLYFQATDGVNGYELWKSDGTEAGTVLVKDINAGSSGSSIQYLTNVNGTLYFRADDGVNGDELWKSDGTAAGTVLVKDINVGSSGSSLSQLTNVNGTLYFQANDGINGTKIWATDGTLGNTQIADMAVLPTGFVSFLGTLFFQAADPDGIGAGLQSLINNAPTDLALSNSTVTENQATGTLIGNLSTTDPDAGNTFTYSLVTGAGSTDNSLFTIVGNQLKTNAVFDFETQNSYSVRVQTTDQGGLTTEKQLTLAVTNVNEAPTNLALSANTITENVNTTAGVLIGNITITDPDATGNNNLLSVQGTDAGSFQIRDTNQLFFIGTSPNYEAKSSYSINLQTTDANSGNPLTYSQAFTINVNDVNEINEIFGDNNSNEKLIGTNSLDVIYGLGGNDILEGGGGNDTLIGGTGTDTAEYKNAPTAVNINLATGVGTDGQGGTDTLTQIENVNGSNYGDLLTGNDQTNVLDGRSGNDTLNGAGGIDTLIGGAGNNALNGGTGIDTADYSRASNGVTVDLSTGTASNNGYGGTDTLTGIEMVYGSNTAGDSLTGNDSNNSLYGYCGADTLTGGRGNDSLYLGVDTVTDTVNYNSGDGSDTVFNFVRGVNGDRLNFSGIANIDVRVSGTSTQFRVGDGTIGNTGFGTGTLLLTTNATTGFVAADANVNLFGATFVFS